MVIERESTQHSPPIFIERDLIKEKKRTISSCSMPIFCGTSSASESHRYIILHLSSRRSRVMQFPIQAWLRITLNHGSITQITILSDGSIIMKSVGDSGFIPANKVTF
jgi:hypothetical protein